MEAQTSRAVDRSRLPYADRSLFRSASVPLARRLTPRVRKFLRVQQILLSIGALICLTLWALRIPVPFVLVLVNALFIGNGLSAVMDYACPLYDRFHSPWTWVVYMPLLAGISVLGVVLA